MKGRSPGAAASPSRTSTSTPAATRAHPLDTVLSARPDLVELEHELATVAEQLGEPEVAADLDRMTRVLHRQEQLLERWDAAGGPSVEGRARATLLELGLTRKSWGCRRARSPAASAS